MKRKLCCLALLLFSLAPLSAVELLANQKSLDLGSLAEAEARFGTAVALSKAGPCAKPEKCPILVVGAPQSNTLGSRSGAAYVFTLVGGTWTRDESFPATGTDTTAFDAYGFSVSVSDDGKFVAVGAPLHDGREGNAGAVYLYTRTSEGWAQRKLIASGEVQRNDQFGTSVALSGDGTVMAVGAPQPNPLREENPHGKAYVFETQGSQRAVLKAKGGENFDFFGFSVAVDQAGATVVVGAPGADVGPHAQAGKAYIFRAGEGWIDRVQEDLPLTLQQNAEESRPKPQTGDELGISVAISSNGATVVAGARKGGEGRAGGSGQGSAYVFHEGNSWQPIELSADVSPCQQGGQGQRQCPELGTSVAMDEDGMFVLVGAPGTALEQGKTYLFRRPQSGWNTSVEPSAEVPACTTGQQEPARFGQAVATRGRRVAVGAPASTVGNASTAGKVCVTGLALDASLMETEVVPGGEVNIEIEVTNPSTSRISSIKLSVRFDNLIEATLNDATENASSEGEVSVLFELEAQSQRTFKFAGTVDSAAEQLTLKVKVESIKGLEDLTSASKKFIPGLTPEVILSIEKDVDKERTARGDDLTYKITVENRGRSLARAVRVEDHFDREMIKRFQWCKVIGTRACEPETSGAINDTFDFPARSILTYTVSATTSSETKERNLINTASVHSARCNTPRKKCASDFAKTTLPRADLQVSIPPDQSAVPGRSANLAIKVINAGEDRVEGAKIETMIGLPAGALTCGGLGENDLDLEVTLEPNTSVDCVLSVSVPAALRGGVDFGAKVSLPLNTDLIDQDTTNNEISDRFFTLAPRSNISILPELLEATIIPGGLPHTYRFQVTNVRPNVESDYGGSDLLGANIEARFPGSFTTVTWTCRPTNLCDIDEGTGDLSTQVHLPVGSTVALEVRVFVEAAATKETVSTTISFQPSASDDRDAAPTIGLTANLQPVTDFAVTHTGPPVVIPGSPLPATYILEARNNGPSVARAARVTHDFKPDLATVVWSCVATRGSCAESGTGELREDVLLEPGGSVTFTVKALANPGLTGILEANARAVALPRGGSIDPRQDNNNLALITPFQPIADLVLTKEFVEDKAEYRITVVNAGPSDVVGAVVRDAPPSGLAPDSTWNCFALGGSCVCPERGCLVTGRGCSEEPATTQVLEGLVSLRVGGKAVFTVEAGSVSGDRNVACVATPPEVVDSRPDNNLGEVEGPVPPS